MCQLKGHRFFWYFYVDWKNLQAMKIYFFMSFISCVSALLKFSSGLKVHIWLDIIGQLNLLFYPPAKQ